MPSSRWRSWPSIASRRSTSRPGSASTCAAMRASSSAWLASPAGPDARRGVVGAAQREEELAVDAVEAAHESAHGGIGPGRVVVVHVVADGADDALGERPRHPQAAQDLAASSAETFSWPMKWPSRRVSALPRSWRSAARRSAGGSSGGAASTARREWSRASPGTALACGTPRSAASSGRITGRSPSRSRMPIARDGAGSSRRMRRSSSRTRSAETRGDGRRQLADRRLGGRVDRQLEAPGEARRADQAQGVLGEALAGSPTARSTRAARSDCPPCGSTSAPRRASRSIGSQAMALIVKSRRARSSVRETPKRTSSGRRRSR